jgi:hypothetical protein
MATLLSDNDLQGYSTMLAPQLLADTCAIMRSPDMSSGTRTPDGQGGYSNASSSSLTGWNVASTSACAVLAPTATSGSEPLAEGQLQSKSQKTLLLPRGTDIRDSDRAKVTSIVNGTQLTTIYEVIEVPDPRTYEIFRRAFILRIGGGTV